jgi:hypothetical protein
MAAPKPAVSQSKGREQSYGSSTSTGATELTIPNVEMDGLAGWLSDDSDLLDGAEERIRDPQAYFSKVGSSRKENFQ